MVGLDVSPKVQHFLCQMTRGRKAPNQNAANEQHDIRYREVRRQAIGEPSNHKQHTNTTTWVFAVRRRAIRLPPQHQNAAKTPQDQFRPPKPIFLPCLRVQRCATSTPASLRSFPCPSPVRTCPFPSHPSPPSSLKQLDVHRAQPSSGEVVWLA
jgi:hypothetical protein